MASESPQQNLMTEANYQWLQISEFKKFRPGYLAKSRCLSNIEETKNCFHHKRVKGL